MKTTRRRVPLVLLAGLALLACWVQTASAEPPSKETFFNSFTFHDTTTCPGITITQHNEERDTIIEYSATKLFIQRHGVATLTANGKTLTSNFSAMIFLDPTTPVQKVVGTVYNIQVPGRGNLMLDAGNIIIDFSTEPWTVLHVGGPHQQFFGDVAGLCDYLAGP
jgi:hypothetical protein